MNVSIVLHDDLAKIRDSKDLSPPKSIKIQQRPGSHYKTSREQLKVESQD